MGYRSSVAFVLSVDGYDKAVPENVEKFKALVGFFKLSEFYAIGTNEDYALQKGDAHGQGIGWKDGCIMFHAEDWKWYPDYSIVQAYDKLWEQMQGLDGVSGYFSRVGEEIDDIVEETFGDDPMFDYFRPCSYLQIDDTIIGDFEVEPTTEEEV
jgi:hypothetical protein